MKIRKTDELPGEDPVPLLSVTGTSHEAGIQLGHAWKEALHLVALRWPVGLKPWWMDRRFAKLVGRYAPHVPDLYRGMAKGAGILEERCAEPAPGGPAKLTEGKDGCTSFAIQPGGTLEGSPISGQTKDTPLQQRDRYVVVRMKLRDAPPALTLTYPGLLFGHGFVKGGCAIFRNALFAGESAGLLPYHVWGLLALHCPKVEDAGELALRHGFVGAGHFTVADEGGGVIGIEAGKGGLVVVKPKQGLYTHANTVVSGKRLGRYEEGSPFTGENSRQRERRLRERLVADYGRLTPQLAMMALCDHANYPLSICRHESGQALTTSAVVVEPTQGRLICTRGAPCRNRPKSYELLVIVWQLWGTARHLRSGKTQRPPRRRTRSPLARLRVKRRLVG